jgi:hypothetical protein
VLTYTMNICNHNFMTQAEIAEQDLLFLERKFHDPDPVAIKSIGATGVVVQFENFDAKYLERFRQLGLGTDVALVAFDSGSCPAQPTSKEKLAVRLANAVKMRPETIWLDHFRFDGKWEASGTDRVSGLHPNCQYCAGKNRSAIMTELGHFARKSVPREIRLGYFGVPLLPSEAPVLTNELGQDPAKLGEAFDAISPMLYHQMIGKPISYIELYINWLTSTTDMTVAPILQVKSMPDELEDTLTAVELRSAYHAAKSNASTVIWFGWDGLEEKDKESDIEYILKTKARGLELQ